MVNAGERLVCTNNVPPLTIGRFQRLRVSPLVKSDAF
jgi:hypothetical protein